MSSQFSDLSTTLSYGGGASRRRSRSRSPSVSVARSLKRRPSMPLYRNLRSYMPKSSKNSIYKFTRVVSTTPVVSQEAVTTNYWYLNNRDLNGIAYGGTTPAVFGNQISIYFDFLSVHMDLYSAGGALVQQVEYGVPSVAEFAALYEDFKIDWVQIDCFASQENAFRSGSAADIPQTSQMLYYTKDYNDGGSTSLTQIMQQQDVSIWQPAIGNKGTYTRRIRLRPKANFTVANAAGGVGGTAQMPRTWLQVDSSQTIPHYGVKMAACNFFPTGAATNTASCYLGFSFTFHFSFRNTK